MDGRKWLLSLLLDTSSSTRRMRRREEKCHKISNLMQNGAAFSHLLYSRDGERERSSHFTLLCTLSNTLNLMFSSPSLHFQLLSSSQSPQMERVMFVKKSAKNES